MRRGRRGRSRSVSSNSCGGLTVGVLCVLGIAMELVVSALVLVPGTRMHTGHIRLLAASVVV